MEPESGYGFANGDFIEGTPYRVVGGRGFGGMGEVYEVDHTRFGTRRALKVVRQVADARSATGRRLVNEGCVLRSIDHPNVVRVFDVDLLPDGRPFFAMELLEGKSLRELLDQQGFLPVETAVLIVAQALRGLGFAHQRGIIHRDVKPSNLMVSPAGQTKILDFGIAKFLDPSLNLSLTAYGVAIGTVKYMAPEQLSGRPLDQRADIYAMGLVLYEALAGVHPYQTQATREAKIYARLKQPAPPMDLFARQAIPERISKIVSEMLAILPENRPADATVLCRHLLAAIGRSIHELDSLGVDLSFTTRVETSVVRRNEPTVENKRTSSAPVSAVVCQNAPLQPVKNSSGAQRIALLVAVAAVATLLSMLVLREIFRGPMGRMLVSSEANGAVNLCPNLTNAVEAK